MKDYDRFVEDRALSPREEQERDLVDMAGDELRFGCISGLPSADCLIEVIVPPKRNTRILKKKGKKP